MKQDNRDNSKNWQTTNTGGTNYVGEIHFHGSEPNSPLTRQEYRNRQALLTKTKNFWVKGVLEKSLYNQVLIELDLEERPDAIANPWSVVLETGDSSPQPLPQGTKVIDIFDQIGAGRTLLILGEPGAGKTTTLLELTRDLIARAEQDVNHLIPVVFNLSSWAVKRHKITDWLVEELNTKYQVPKKIGQPWLEQQQLLPLLDGLDEVKAEYREQCIDALNAFHQEYGSELVVCSRIKDYNALSNRLNFQSAIYIRSLTLEQISHYLDSVSSNFTGLRALIKEDTALQELASSPLMLNIMVLAYEGVALEDLPKTEVVEQHRKQLFNAYIDKMFKRQDVNQRYLKTQAMHWLILLAQRMHQESQTVFFIERIQPSWLHTNIQTITYRIMNIVISGLIAGAVGFLLQFMWIFISILTRGFSSFISFIILVITLVFMGGVFWGLKKSTKQQYIILISKKHKIILALFLIFISISIFSFIPSLFFILPTIHIFLGILIAIFLKLGIGEIKTLEVIKWSWLKARNSSLLGLVLGIPIILLFLTFIFVILGAIALLQKNYSALTGSFFLIKDIATYLISQKIFIFYILVYLGIYLIFIGLAFGIAGGITGSTIEAKTRSNQGIWMSLKNTARISSFLLCITSLISTMFLSGGLFLMLSQPFPWIIIGANIGIILSVGKSCIQHFILRLILYRNGYMPWNYAQFLDYAADRIFLQKVGGGYIFIHRLLMEHFAQMELDS